MKKSLLTMLALIMVLSSMAGMVRGQDFTFVNDLTVGSSNPDVANLQTWLIANGYSIPSVNAGITPKGYFGAQTRAALMGYQAAHGIPSTGFFGPITRGYLNGNKGGDNNGGGNGGDQGSALYITSPRGGEVWQKGTTQNITWNGAPGILNQTGDIRLEYPAPACANPNSPVRCMIATQAPLTIATGVSLSQRSYAWYVSRVLEHHTGTNTDLAFDGSYKIQICSSNSNVCAESGDNFTISSSPVSNGSRPVINGVDAPTTLNVNQVGTWSVHATDPLNGTLKYIVDWGDTAPCPTGYICSTLTSYGALNNSYQTSTFTHSYAYAGVYTATFTVSNSTGQSSQISATVQVTNSGNTAGPLRITSPNGGENWVIGTTQNITWTSPYYIRATYADLKLIRLYDCRNICPAIAYLPLTIASGISINQNSYSWNVGSYSPDASSGGNAQLVAPDGTYKVQICESGGTNCDLSDAAFTVTSQTSAVPDINIVSPNGGETLTMVGVASGHAQVSVNVSGDPAQVGHTVNFYLVDQNNQQTFVSTQSISGTGTKSFDLTLPGVRYGSYKLYVTLISGQRMQAYDYSDNYFTLQYLCPPGYVCN